MPYVHRLISRLWTELPSSVHEYEEVTSRGGGPAPTMREAILAHLLRNTALGTKKIRVFSFTRDSYTLLTDSEEQIFTDAFRKAIPHIVLHAEWLHLLAEGRDKPGNSFVELSKLGLTTRKLAAKYPKPFELDVDERDTLIHDALSERAGDTIPGAVNSAIKRHREELERLLDELWSAGWEGPTTRSHPGETIRKFVADCGFVGGIPTVGPEAAIHWGTISGSAYAPQFEEDKPDLTTAADYSAGSTAGTLGSSIRRRLQAGKGLLLPKDLTALSLVEQTIEWSVRPYGVPEQWCWAVMAIGEQVSAVLSPPENSTASRRALYAKSKDISDHYGGGGWSTILSNWARISVAAQQSGSVGKNRLVDAPERYYLGRLRGRVLMRALTSDVPPDAEWVWANVYGALKSTFMEAKVLPFQPAQTLEEKS